MKFDLNLEKSDLNILGGLRFEKNHDQSQQNQYGQGAENTMVVGEAFNLPVVIAK